MASILDERAWSWIRHHGHEVTFARGDPLLHEGEHSTHVFAVEEGEVKALAHSRSGETVLLAVIRPGQLFGLLAALDERPRESSAVARCDGVMWRLSRKQYLQLMTDYPHVAIAQLELMASFLRRTVHLIVERSDNLTSRISSRLQALADQGDGTEVEITQADLAHWVGATREATVRSLGTLRSAGAVATHRGRITITDVDALERFQ